MRETSQSTKEITVSHSLSKQISILMTALALMTGLIFTEIKAQSLPGSADGNLPPSAQVQEAETFMPEPLTLLLFGIGLATFGIAARQRFKVKASGFYESGAQ